MASCSVKEWWKDGFSAELGMSGLLHWVTGRATGIRVDALDNKRPLLIITYPQNNNQIYTDRYGAGDKTRRGDDERESGRCEGSGGFSDGIRSRGGGTLGRVSVLDSLAALRRSTRWRGCSSGRCGVTLTPNNARFPVDR